MAALEAVALSVFSPSSSSSKFHNQLASAKLKFSHSAPPLSLNFPFPPLRLNNNNPTKKPCFVLLCSAVQEAATAEESQEPSSENKIAFFKLPLSFTAEDIKALSSQCGTVIDAELITTKDGKPRGFGFVTMSTAEEAQAVIDKFDSQEMAGKVIRVGKKIYKPSVVWDGRLVYVSNLAWKVKSEHLKEFFSPDFNPISAKVIFKRTPWKRSAGYGFVKFATNEEAEASISALNGKPLMDRPLQMKISYTTNMSKLEEGDLSETQPGDT